MDFIWASFFPQLQADVVNYPDVQGAVLVKFVKIQCPDISASLPQASNAASPSPHATSWDDGRQRYPWERETLQVGNESLQRLGMSWPAVVGQRRPGGHSRPQIKAGICSCGYCRGSQ